MEKLKILYFLFEGLCNNLQEIEIEDHEEIDSKNSQFFRLEAQEIGFGCYFYLPKEKTSLKKYLSSNNIFYLLNTTTYFFNYIFLVKHLSFIILRVR